MNVLGLSAVVLQTLIGASALSIEVRAPQQTIMTHTAAVDIDVSADGNLLAVTGRGRLDLYEVSLRRWRTPHFPIAGGRSRFTRDGTKLLSFGYGERPGQAWDLSHEPPAQMTWDVRIDTAHSDFCGDRYARIIQRDMGPNDWVEGGHWSGDAPTFKLYLPWQLHRDIALSKSGRYLAVINGQSGINDMSILVRDVDNEAVIFEKVWENDPLKFVPFIPNECVFTNHDTSIAICGESFLDISDMEVLEVFEVLSYELATREVKWSQRNKAFKYGDMGSSSDGRLLAVAMTVVDGDEALLVADGTRYLHGIRIFEATSGREIVRLASPKGCTKVVFAPDNRKVYAISHNVSSVFVWEISPIGDDESK